MPLVVTGGIILVIALGIFVAGFLAGTRRPTPAGR
jgi:hypothetical protein